MEKEEDDAPLAVELEETVPVQPSSSHAKQLQGEDVPVGVTVITGYLGSGKSTLVNHILSTQHGKRIAVILNEFGEEIGVERAMINEGEDGALVEEWVELDNGCVCCTVKHSLVQALEQLVQMKERLDHILLETTGLANPAPLASVLWLDDQLEAAVKLDSIITVVDAKNLHYQLNELQNSSSFPEAFHQIAFADVIILNKIDLVSSGGAYDSKHFGHLEVLLEESKSLSTGDLHDSRVRTLCICEPQKVDLDKVRLWVEEILWDKKDGMDVYRCKGILHVRNSDELHTLQAVRELYDIVPARRWRSDENQTNKIVFIGHNLKEDVLIDSFKGCIGTT
ncbi:COBW DOMAIN-CONTAINING PROTEIN 1-RELATED [Salix koriyanagi]|uniref:COBW DOMAIN-CONTAINING PROTEIN 1-RELATED n=1 Tax=Salix koriyanagi TaxID=2511006 RepID=A0A9Q0WK54_9ROSI|nr:COBW DOMAIN-CONTAINING PROTEIN 1-RELATED [Salix koriyanagi]